MSDELIRVLGLTMPYDENLVEDKTTPKISSVNYLFSLFSFLIGVVLNLSGYIYVFTFCVVSCL